MGRRSGHGSYRDQRQGKDTHCGQAHEENEHEHDEEEELALEELSPHHIQKAKYYCQYSKERHVPCSKKERVLANIGQPLFASSCPYKQALQLHGKDRQNTGHDIEYKTRNQAKNQGASQIGNFQIFIVIARGKGKVIPRRRQKLLFVFLGGRG